MAEDRVDLYCNQIHVTCIGLQRLRKQHPYNLNLAFLELVDRFCHKAENLMQVIRVTEGRREAPEPFPWIAIS